MACRSAEELKLIPTHIHMLRILRYLVFGAIHETVVLGQMIRARMACVDHFTKRSHGVSIDPGLPPAIRSIDLVVVVTQMCRAFSKLCLPDLSYASSRIQLQNR